jgi:hypothetical protein
MSDWKMLLYNVLGGGGGATETLIMGPACDRFRTGFILVWRLGHTRTINQGSRSHEHPYEAGTCPLCILMETYL